MFLVKALYNLFIYFGLYLSPVEILIIKKRNKGSLVTLPRLKLLKSILDHHHDVAIEEFGHLLTRSDLTHIQKSLRWSSLAPFAYWSVVFYQSV
jgi:hypothetical protein